MFCAQCTAEGKGFLMLEVVTEGHDLAFLLSIFSAGHISLRDERHCLEDDEDLLIDG